MKALNLREDAQEALREHYPTPLTIAETEQIVSGVWEPVVRELLDALDDTEHALGDLSAIAMGVRRRIRERLGDKPHRHVFRKNACWCGERR